MIESQSSVNEIDSAIETKSSHWFISLGETLLLGYMNLGVLMATAQLRVVSRTYTPCRSSLKVLNSN